MFIKEPSNVCVKRSVGLSQFTSVGPEKQKQKNKSDGAAGFSRAVRIVFRSGTGATRAGSAGVEEEEEEEVRFNVSSEETETHVVCFSSGLMFLSRLRFPIKSLVFAVLRVRSALF